jgi:uncharacterized protein
MQYRTFPKMPDLKISVLGFGCMRLPVLNGDFARIDEEAASGLLHAAIEAGVNYLDTAWPYHAEQSELFVGRALKGGLRNKVQIATKHPVWLVNTESDWERYLDAQLKKLDTPRIDFYLLHALATERWGRVRQLNGLKAMEKAKADGRIGHIGFSFHGSLTEFKTITDGYDWEFCQIQFNFLDEEFQAGLEGMSHASARNVGVIVMEPLRGGSLARVPQPVQSIWGRSGRAWSPAEWALRWVCQHPEPVTVLSGMNSMEQLRENLNVADKPILLTDEDLAFVAEVKSFYRARVQVPCTTCGYCMPCPSGVSIPNALSLYNDAIMFESTRGPAFVYDHFFLKAGAGADQCTECGECETKCPQGIQIPERLKEAHALLAGVAPTQVIDMQ